MTRPAVKYGSAVLPKKTPALGPAAQSRMKCLPEQLRVIILSAGEGRSLFPLMTNKSMWYRSLMMSNTAIALAAGHGTRALKPRKEARRRTTRS